jgi:hypothetical protein
MPEPTRENEVHAPYQYVLWLCDACGDNAEQDPGSTCEACEAGTIRVVPVVPEAEVARLRAAALDLLAHPRSAGAHMRMHTALGTNPLTYRGEAPDD